MWTIQSSMEILMRKWPKHFLHAFQHMQIKRLKKTSFQAANKLQLFSPECTRTQLFSFSCQSAADDKFAAPQQNANCASVPILLPGGVPNMSFKRAELPLHLKKKKKI